MIYRIILMSIALLVLASFASAGTIHEYSFTVENDEGVSHGTFSYDDHGLSDTSILGLEFTDFDFHWQGVDYTTDMVSGGKITLGANGEISRLHGSFMGSNCVLGGCSVEGTNTLDWQIDVLPFVVQGFGNTIFKYGTGSTVAAATLSIEYTSAFRGSEQVMTVPEPGNTLLLVALALTALLAFRLPNLIAARSRRLRAQYPK